MVKNISIRQLRSNLAHVLDDVKRHFDRYIISKRGQPEAVIMCVDDYEGWLETLEIMSDKEAVEDIRIARKELKEGKSFSFEEVFGRAKKKTKSKAEK
jgi:prevent-host-death family protein